MIRRLIKINKNRFSIKRRFSSKKNWEKKIIEFQKNFDKYKNDKN